MKKAVILILLLSAFLRFHHLPDLFVFGGDEEHHVLLANTIVKHFHIIWVGVNVAHLGIYHGPFFTYFTAFWLFFTQDPIILAYVAAILGTATTAAVIFVGFKLFNKKVALISGLLYATLPLMVFYDQRYWNPSITPLLMLGMIFVLWESRKNSLWLTLFAFCYGLIFHTHFSLFPMIIVAIYFLIKERVKVSKQSVFLSIVVFLLMISPLIVFDYFQHWVTITTPLRFNQISKDPADKINPIHHSISLFETLGRIWYLKPNISSSDETLVSCTSVSILGTPTIVDQTSSRTKVPLLSALSFILITFFLIRKNTWKKINTKLVAMCIILIIGTFLLFPGGAFEYYIRGIFPLILFIPGIFFNDFKKFRKIIITTILIFSTLGIYTVMTASGEYGLNTKKDLISKVMKVVAKDSFEIAQDKSICHIYEGWRQLFIFYSGRRPSRSFSDGSLGWYYQSEISKEKSKYLIILGDKKVPIDFDIKNAQIFSSGNFQAYIFKQ